MPRLNVYGAIIPNDYKWYYDYFEEDSTCPRDVDKAITEANGDLLDIYINSPGGVISSGSDIYTALRAYGNIKIHITGEACSAASIIAMAGESEMSPTALMMVHCVSVNPGRGNHSHMEHTAEMLRTADEALCTAYMAKANMSQEDALAMMEEETWLTAEEALARGLIDGIMFEEQTKPVFTGSMFELPSEEKMNRVRMMLKEQDPVDQAPLLQQRLNYLKLMEVTR